MKDSAADRITGKIGRRFLIAQWFWPHFIWFQLFNTVNRKEIFCTKLLWLGITLGLLCHHWSHCQLCHNYCFKENFVTRTSQQYLVWKLEYNSISMPAKIFMQEVGSDGITFKKKRLVYFYHNKWVVQPKHFISVNITLCLAILGCLFLML